MSFFLGWLILLIVHLKFPSRCTYFKSFLIDSFQSQLGCQDFSYQCAGYVLQLFHSIAVCRSRTLPNLQKKKKIPCLFSQGNFVNCTFKIPFEMHIFQVISYILVPIPAGLSRFFLPVCGLCVTTTSFNCCLSIRNTTRNLQKKKNTLSFFLGQLILLITLLKFPSRCTYFKSFLIDSFQSQLAVKIFPTSLRAMCYNYFIQLLFVDPEHYQKFTKKKKKNTMSFFLGWLILLIVHLKFPSRCTYFKSFLIDSFQSQLGCQDFSYQCAGYVLQLFHSIAVCRSRTLQIYKKRKKYHVFFPREILLIVLLKFPSRCTYFKSFLIYSFQSQLGCQDFSYQFAGYVLQLLHSIAVCRSGTLPEIYKKRKKYPVFFPRVVDPVNYSFKIPFEMHIFQVISYRLVPVPAGLSRFFLPVCGLRVTTISFNCCLSIRNTTRNLQKKKKIPCLFSQGG